MWCYFGGFGVVMLWRGGCGARMEGLMLCSYGGADVVLVFQSCGFKFVAIRHDAELTNLRKQYLKVLNSMLWRGSNFVQRQNGDVIFEFPFSFGLVDHSFDFFIAQMKTLGFCIEDASLVC